MTVASKFDGELRQGWRLLLGAFLGVGAGYASVYFYTQGLFIKPLVAQFGWTRAQASLGSIAGLVGAMIAMPVVGRLTDRIGAVRVAFWSVLAFAASLALLGGLTQGLVSFLILTALLTATSPGTGFIAYNRIIVANFVKHRGLALGIAMTGSGIGAIIVPIFLAPYIEAFGWRAGYGVLAFLALALGLAAILALRKADGDGARPPAVPWLVILNQKAFFTIVGTIVLVSLAIPGTTLHIVPLITDRGVSVQVAGLIVSMLGVSVVVARIVTGYLLDRWNPGAVMAVLLVLAAAGMLCLASESIPLVVLGALLLGFGMGFEGDMMAFLVGRRFPLAQYGSAYAALLMIHGLAVALGAYGAGRFFDLNQSYTLWLLMAALALMIAAAIAYATEGRNA